MIAQSRSWHSQGGHVPHPPRPMQFTRWRRGGFKRVPIKRHAIPRRIRGKHVCNCQRCTATWFPAVAGRCQYILRENQARKAQVAPPPPPWLNTLPPRKKRMPALGLTASTSEWLALCNFAFGFARVRIPSSTFAVRLCSCCAAATALRVPPLVVNAGQFCNWAF